MSQNEHPPDLSLLSPLVTALGAAHHSKLRSGGLARPPWLRLDAGGSEDSKCVNGEIVALCAALGGCAAAPKMLWVRADGQRSAENPALVTQYELDSTSCLGERNKANYRA